METYNCEYQDLNVVSAHLGLLEQELYKFEKQEKNNKDKIKELEEFCNERALIITTQQTSFRNLEIIVDKLQNQCEKVISDEVEKRKLLDKIIKLDSENFQLKDQFALNSRDWSKKHNYVVEQYETKIRQIINANLEKEDNLSKNYQKIVCDKVKEIDLLKDQLEAQSKEHKEIKECMKSEFEVKLEEIKKEYKTMNNFSPNISSDFYRKKYEFIQIESDKRINELMNQLNILKSNENSQRKPPKNLPSTQLFGRRNEKTMGNAKNQEAFVSAASLLDQDSEQFFYDTLSTGNDLPKNYTQINNRNNSKTQMEFNNDQNNINKTDQFRIPQKRRLFTINSVNNLEK